MAHDLTDFVRRALEQKLPRDEIARALSDARWPDAEIRAALGAFADVAFPIPVPRPRPYLPARDMFTYLVLFGALYSSVWHVSALLFGVIDKLLPDPVRSDYGSYTDDSIRWAIAGLVVSFPLFLFVFRIVNARIARDPVARDSRPRKWLTYLTLALAVSALTADLAGLVYNALNGDLSVPIILKALVVALIAGGTFAYFYMDVRQGEDA